MALRLSIAAAALATALAALAIGPLPAGAYSAAPAGPAWTQGGNPTPGQSEIGSWTTITIREASAYCAALPDRAYQIDCLSERLGYIASQIPGNGPYRETKWALDDAAKKLALTAEKYRDPGRAPKRFRSAASARMTQTSTRPILPVRAAAAAAAVAAAQSVIAETQTALLRSSDANPAIAAQVQEIAAAVGSNKFLLRSA
jgi:hypothetical protein